MALFETHQEPLGYVGYLVEGGPWKVLLTPGNSPTPLHLAHQHVSRNPIPPASAGSALHRLPLQWTETTSQNQSSLSLVVSNTYFGYNNANVECRLFDKLLERCLSLFVWAKSEDRFEEEDFCFVSHITLLLDVRMVLSQEHLVIVNFNSWDGRVRSP